MKWMNASPNLTAVAPNGAKEGSDFILAITPPDSVTEHGSNSTVWQATREASSKFEKQQTNKQDNNNLGLLYSI